MCTVMFAMLLATAVGACGDDNAEPAPEVIEKRTVVEKEKQPEPAPVQEEDEGIEADISFDSEEGAKGGIDIKVQSE